MEKGLKISLLALLLIAGSSFADCYRSSDLSGRVEFEGVADGSGFTGSFGEFEVSLCMDESLADAEIRVTVKTGSADTGNRLRDGELHGKNLFAVDAFPESTWTSASIEADGDGFVDRKSTRLNSSHVAISYAVFCMKKKKALVGARAS